MTACRFLFAQTLLLSSPLLSSCTHPDSAATDCWTRTWWSAEVNRSSWKWSRIMTSDRTPSTVNKDSHWDMYNCLVWSRLSELAVPLSPSSPDFVWFPMISNDFQWPPAGWSSYLLNYLFSNFETKTAFLSFSNVWTSSSSLSLSLSKSCTWVDHAMLCKRFLSWK